MKIPPRHRRLITMILFLLSLVSAVTMLPRSHSTPGMSRRTLKILHFPWASSVLRPRTPSPRRLASSSAPVVVVVMDSRTTPAQRDFVKLVAPAALYVHQKTGISMRTLISQWALESGWAAHGVWRSGNGNGGFQTVHLIPIYF